MRMIFLPRLPTADLLFFLLIHTVKAIRLLLPFFISIQYKNMRKLFQNAAADIPAAVVVFLVALPLCLGIALGSGAPLFSGIIAGIIGGIVVGALSGSNVSVSGPAAGL